MLLQKNNLPGVFAYLFIYDFYFSNIFQGIQSDYGSFLYVPGYNPYPTTACMGADGHQPYLSSSGHTHNCISCGLDAMSCYWNSTYAGDASGTTCGSVKSAQSANLSAKPKGFNNPMKTNNSFGKSYTLQRDTSSRQYTASPNFPDSFPHARSLKPSNQV